MWGVVYLIAFGIPLGVLAVLLRASKRPRESIAAILGMVFGAVTSFPVLLKLIPYGDGGGPIFSLLGALVLGAPLGAVIFWFFAKNFVLRRA